MKKHLGGADVFVEECAAIEDIDCENLHIQLDVEAVARVLDGRVGRDHPLLLVGEL
jgi:hypothetical protein